MKKIFQVGNKHFETKATAKAFRDSTDAPKGAKVSKGPDHWLFGVQGHPRTHSHNGRSGGSGNGFKRQK